MGNGNPGREILKEILPRAILNGESWGNRWGSKKDCTARKRVIKKGE